MPTHYGDGESRFQVTQMSEWSGVSADLAITDPPFGIDFDSEKSNYNRDSGEVVDGYVEWDSATYRERVETLVDILYDNTTDDGQSLVFSGWNNSSVIHDVFREHDRWTLEGKMYWDYNFAPYCTRRPAHNVYEIFWAVKNDDWYYTNECSYDHCQDGEANLSVISVDRNYLPEREKYPTRLPPKVVKVLVEHFSVQGDRLFDPLAGSGTVGVVGEQLGREYVLGDCNTEAKRMFCSDMEALFTDVAVASDD
jgi:DNA modification methylase